MTHTAFARLQVAHKLREYMESHRAEILRNTTFDVDKALSNLTVGGIEDAGV